MIRDMRLVTVAIAAVLVVASCQPSAEPDPSVERSSVGAVIERLFSTGSVELLDAQDARDLEEAIGTCMRAEGFEYYPEPIDAGVTVGPVSVEGVEYGSDEWTVRYGFGISTQRYDPLLSNGTLGGIPGGVGAVPTENRNGAYVENLPASGQAAYQAALDGTPLDTRERTAEEEERSYARSCEGTAVASVAPAVLLIDSLMNELAEIGSRYVAHPVVIQEAARVERCVAEAGYDPMTEISARTTISNRLGQEVESRIEGSDPPMLSPDGIEALKEIQELEVEWAQALEACGGLSYQRTPEVQAVVDELRDEFLGKYVTPIGNE
ncbi:hypothetical protein MNBD_ACTINO02-1592 [hydrothermal vent metagenome]|uniref:Uncharacterized protein n=1 Tax=hydrothermal vent metagenome TaxID=652676 RepID=A0A3B0S4B7_9ZZZZ